MESSLGEGQDIHRGIYWILRFSAQMGYLEGMPARELALQRSLRKGGRHSPGAQNTPQEMDGWRRILSRSYLGK